MTRLRAAQGAGWALLVLAPLAFLAVFFAYPVGSLVVRGFVTDGALDLGGFGEVLQAPRTWRVVRQTFVQALLGTALALGLGVPGAYVLYRLRIPGRTAWRALVTLPFVLPTVVVGVAFRSLVSAGGPLGPLGLDQTLTAVLAALVFFNYGLVVRMVGTVWERLDVRPAQAAAALGASPARVLRTVTLPALAPAIASAGSLVFLFCATAFGVVMVLGGPRYGTVETEIWVQTTQFLDLRTASVLSIVQLLVVTLSLLLSARARRRRERALPLVSASRAASPLRIRTAGAGGGPRSAGTLGAIAVTAITVAVVVLLPLGSLVVGSLRRSGRWTFANYADLAGTGAAVGSGSGALGVSVWEAAATSVRIATDAMLIALLVGVSLAVVLSRRPRLRALRQGITAIDALVMLPLGVSAVTLGFGFLVALDRPPLDLRSSAILVPIAQALVAVPLVVRTVLPVLRAISPRQREVAAVLGASPVRVFLSVDVPLALRALGLAAAFAFATSLGEFGATSFLSRPDRPTLPVVIFRLISRPGVGNDGMALAASVLLALLVAGVMGLAERLRSGPASVVGGL